MWNGPLITPYSLPYPQVAKELEQLERGVVEEVGESVKAIRLRCCDDGRRKHSLILRLKNDYPLSAPECIADLPYPFDPMWSPNAGLVDILSQFQGVLRKYQQLWEVRRTET